VDEERWEEEEKEDEDGVGEGQMLRMILESII